MDELSMTIKEIRRRMCIMYDALEVISMGELVGGVAASIIAREALRKLEDTPDAENVSV